MLQLIYDLMLLAIKLGFRLTGRFELGSDDGSNTFLVLNELELKESYVSEAGYGNALIRCEQCKTEASAYHFKYQAQCIVKCHALRITLKQFVRFYRFRLTSDLYSFMTLSYLLFPRLPKACIAYSAVNLKSRLGYK